MLRKQLLKHFDTAVKKAGLAQHRDALLADARECVQFHYGNAPDELPLGASHVGGTPDLPASIEWPDGVLEGKPFGKAEFLAQFNLAELPAVDDLGLPRQGHLWLFVRDTSLCDVPVTVFFGDGTEPLVPRKKPRSKARPPQGVGWSNLKLAALKFSLGVSLPFSSKAFNCKWQSESLPHDGLYKLHKALGADSDIDGRIGGYSNQAEFDLCRQIAIEILGKPDYIYADAWESVAQLDEQIARGLPFGNNQAYRDSLRQRRPQVEWIEKNQAKIAGAAASIRLLCMFRDSDHVGLDFGDGMFLDFLINESALAQRDFRNVRCRLPMLL